MELFLEHDNPTKTWTILITTNDFSPLSVELHLMSTMWNTDKVNRYLVTETVYELVKKCVLF